MQLEELLLDEPENQDYQGLYADVQEVRKANRSATRAVLMSQ